MLFNTYLLTFVDEVQPQTVVLDLSLKSHSGRLGPNTGAASVFVALFSLKNEVGIKISKIKCQEQHLRQKMFRYH